MARARVSTPTLPVEVTVHLATGVTALDRHFDATQCRDQVAQHGVVDVHTVLQVQPHDIAKELARSRLALILCLGARPITINAVEVLINLTCIARVARPVILDVEVAWDANHIGILLALANTQDHDGVSQVRPLMAWVVLRCTKQENVAPAIAICLELLLLNQAKDITLKDM